MFIIRFRKRINIKPISYFHERLKDCNHYFYKGSFKLHKEKL